MGSLVRVAGNSGSAAAATSTTTSTASDATGRWLQVVQLEKELAAQAETAEEKRQAARLQRRLSDAQAAEVAAAVQAKLLLGVGVGVGVGVQAKLV